jgi:GTP-dependent phosphoenolpyruvate carboxykinase
MLVCLRHPPIAVVPFVLVIVSIFFRTWLYLDALILVFLDVFV